MTASGHAVGQRVLKNVPFVPSARQSGGGSYAGGHNNGARGRARDPVAGGTLRTRRAGRYAGGYRRLQDPPRGNTPRDATSRDNKRCRRATHGVGCRPTNHSKGLRRPPACLRGALYAGCRALLRRALCPTLRYYSLRHGADASPAPPQRPLTRTNGTNF